MSVRINPTNAFISHPIRRQQFQIHHRVGFLSFKGVRAQGLNRTKKTSFSAVSSVWDEKPYELLPGGEKLYIDEGDVVDFLSSKKLIPLDPSSYNPAAYLWKKISDIPEERRHRLLSLIHPRLISRAWAIAGKKYVDPILLKKLRTSLVSNADTLSSPEYWICRSSGGGPVPVSWIKFFNKAIFSSGDGKTYGRFFGGSFLSNLSNYFPLYFSVKEVDVVLATERPCDLAYEFGDGVFDDLKNLPQDFPKPAKHPWPFSDQVVVYIRQVGPGVLVGQVWQEGQDLEQLPKMLCGDILMIKEYA